MARRSWTGPRAQLIILLAVICLRATPGQTQDPAAAAAAAQAAQQAASIAANQAQQAINDSNVQAMQKAQQNHNEAANGSNAPFVSPTYVPSPSTAPTPSPAPSPVPLPSPVPSPIPSPIPSPTPLPTPLPSPSPLPSPALNPSPSPSSAPSPSPQGSVPMPTPSPVLSPSPSMSPTPSPSPSTSPGTSRTAGTAFTAQTVLNIYGPSVQPFISAKAAAMQQAVAQSVGHGISAAQVQVSVVATYAGQQGRRRLQQASSRLVQPGVQLRVQIPTTQSLATPIQSALSSAVAGNQLVNAYKAQNGQQADYTALVSQQVSESGGTVPVAPNTSPPPPSNSSGGKSFPAWTIAIIVILGVALIAVVAGYLGYRKYVARREARAGGDVRPEAAKLVPSFAEASPPSGGKFVDESPPVRSGRLVDFRHQPSPVSPVMGTPVGSPYSPYRPVSPSAPVYVTPQRNPLVSDAIRGIGRI